MAARHRTYYTVTVMKIRVKVVLYGDTLVLAGLRVSLAAYPEIEVRDATDVPLDEQALRTWQPDVVIVDEAAPPALLHQLSTLSPGLLLVSIDSVTSQIIVFSARQVAVASIRELIEFISQQRLAQSCAAP